MLAYSLRDAAGAQLSMRDALALVLSAHAELQGAREDLENAITMRDAGGGARTCYHNQMKALLKSRFGIAAR